MENDEDKPVYVSFTLTRAQCEELNRAAHKAGRTRASHIRVILAEAGAITPTEFRYKLPYDEVTGE